MSLLTNFDMFQKKSIYLPWVLQQDIFILFRISDRYRIILALYLYAHLNIKSKKLKCSNNSIIKLKDNDIKYAKKHLLIC